jgi:thioredoxin reductase (NADPH)
MKEEKKDLLIIGAGPAGLGAAVYAARSSIDFKIVDKFMAGGQIVKTEFIENYPGFKDRTSGFELMQNMIEHCKNFGVSVEENIIIESVKRNEAAAGKKDSVNKNKYSFLCKKNEGLILSKSLIIATGASPRRLFVEGEDGLIGRGISFCATCDGALYRDKEVMVIGGGDTAIQEALFLTKFASKVYVIHRRDELRAVKLLQQRAFKNERIEFIWDSVIEKFMGKERLEKVIIKNVKTGSSTGKIIDGVFEYIGITPNSGLVKDIVKSDGNGFIITNMNMETDIAGIFAAGDVRNTPLRQVITAVSDGAIAATYADMFISSLM